MQRGVIHRSASTHCRLRPGGPFVRHAISPPDNYIDKGKRGRNSHRIFMSGQKRGAFGALTYKSRRCIVIEPVIGHPGRLKGPASDTTNAFLSAFGQHSRRILAWLSNTFCACS
jgi:hypothetical protein